MSTTTNKGLEKPAHNADVDTWDVPVNNNSDIVDACLGATTLVNMTGRSSYTLSASDIRATTIKFTQTLNSGAIPIKLNNGLSGEFTMIDATVPTDATSRLSFEWTSGGTSLVLNQGNTQIMTADGVNLIWSASAPQFLQGQSNIDITGASGVVGLSEFQCRNRVIVFTGTGPSSGFLQLGFPNTCLGLYAIVNAWSSGGSGTVFLSVTSASGVNAVQLTANVNVAAALYKNPGATNNFTWVTL